MIPTERVHRLFAERLNREAPSDDVDLFASGVLDSLGLVELILALGETFALNINYEELAIDDLRSVAAIARFVSARQARLVSPLGTQE